MHSNQPAMSIPQTYPVKSSLLHSTPHPRTLNDNQFFQDQLAHEIGFSCKPSLYSAFQTIPYSSLVSGLWCFHSNHTHFLCFSLNLTSPSPIFSYQHIFWVVPMIPTLKASSNPPSLCWWKILIASLSSSPFPENVNSIKTEPLVYFSPDANAWYFTQKLIIKYFQIKKQPLCFSVFFKTYL